MLSKLKYNPKIYAQWTQWSLGGKKNALLGNGSGM